MERILAILVAALMLSLLTVGCSGSRTPAETQQPSQQDDISPLGQGDETISGAIVSADSLGSDLSDPDLDDMDAQLAEIDW